MITLLRKKKIVLASKSPRRALLFQQLGLKFTVMESDIREEIPENEMVTPDAFVMSMALKKTRNIGNKINNGLIVGADTVVVSDSIILGKPTDPSNARNMLAQLSGTTHRVYTGIVLLFKPENIIKTDFDVTEVQFKEITNNEIIEYVQSGEPMDKAGAYGIQGLGSLFIKKVNGCFFNVMGFPISKFYDLYKSVYEEIN